MSTISAGTTTTTGYVVTSDTTGALVLKTGASGTTAVTVGADQSVTFAGSQTFSGGTANGVLYLNGSKVATSGSALTFDGTTLGNSTSGTPLSLNRTGAGTALIELKQSGTVGSYLGTSGASDMIFFNGSAAELMRLNGTGLGIGTSSPARKLQVNSGEAVAARFTRGGGIVANNSLEWFDGTNGWYAGVSGSNFWGVAYNSSGGIDSAAIRLDSSGNLGLGVTPSAWDTAYQAIQLPNGGSISGYKASAAPILELSSNQYYDGGYKYVISAAATKYSQNQGVHSWSVAPSGTAGNAITFTQAMTLDASGNLEIGGTFAQGRKLAVDSSTNGYTMQLLQTSAFSSGNLAGTVYSGYYDGSSITDMASIRGGKENTTSGNFAGMLAFYTRANGGSDTERARIDSSGNFMVGVTTAQGRFSVGGAIAGAGSSQLCRIGSTDYGADTVLSVAPGVVNFDAPGIVGGRLRIDSSGNLLLGATSQIYSSKFLISGDSGIYNLQVIKDTRTGSFPDNAYAAFLNDSNVLAGRIAHTASTTVAYVTSSDYRLKENIQPMIGALSKVAQLKPCTYTWKEDGKAGQGFIAHEVQAVVPDAVVGAKDAINEDGSINAQGIDTSFLVATLTAAIQEQQALIESLTQRIAALEGQ